MAAQLCVLVWVFLNNECVLNLNPIRLTHTAFNLEQFTEHTSYRFMGFVDMKKMMDDLQTFTLSKCSH